ncbi:MAG: hypothetical protein ABI895_35980 [Deltaproteobacteria bacterium]
MARPKAVIATAILFCLAGVSCERLLGSVDVGSTPQLSEQMMSGAEGVVAPAQPLNPAPPISGGGPLEVVGGNPTLAVPRLDAGAPSREPPALEPPALGTTPDAGPPAPAPRGVVAEGPANELEQVGVAGGEPRLGACDGGVVIGVRPTANPSLELFGQRLTFIEPICGRVSIDPAGASLSVVRDDSLLTWAATAPLLGVPSREVPDPSLIWVLQPATLCPEAAPVLVGLSGQYDPIAPDYPDSDAIRSLVIECAPLVIAPNDVDIAAATADHQLISQVDAFATSGTATYQSSCQDGSVVTQIHVDAGYWLDGFVLGCTRLRSP